MPLDPRIPLSVQGPQVANPMDLYAQILRLQDARENSAALQQERTTNDQINQVRLATLRQNADDDAQATRLAALLTDPEREAEVFQQVTNPRVQTKLKEYLDTRHQGAQAIEDINNHTRTQAAQVLQLAYPEGTDIPLAIIGATLKLDHDQSAAGQIWAQLQQSGDAAAGRRLVNYWAAGGPKAAKPEAFTLGENQERYEVRPGETTPTVVASGPKGPEKGTLQEQYGRALLAGETEKADQLLTAITNAAAAGRDPEAKAMAVQLQQLRADMLREQIRRLRDPNAGVSQESVDYWTGQIQRDPTMWNMLNSNKPLQNAVQAGLATKGIPLAKITQATRQQAETAREILPQIKKIKQEAQDLDQAGLLGALRGRWTDLATKKIGAESLVKGPENARKAGKFMTDVGLLMTAVARAHGGARGGGSPTMLKHMEDIMSAHGKDLSIFLGNLDAAEEWMTGYATQDQPQAGGPPPPPTPPPASPYSYQSYVNSRRK